MTGETKIFVAFAGTSMIARGALTDVVLRSKTMFDSGADARIALYEDATGRIVDIDLGGGEADVLARLVDHPGVGDGPPANKQKGPGRPKLGVVSREVSLLPRHWEWLGAQRGGASAALRRLVDTARKQSSAEERMRRAIEAAHRFLWDLAGDLPGFEDASRALFAHDFDTLGTLTVAWPEDVREQLRRFIDRAREAEADGVRHPSDRPVGAGPSRAGVLRFVRE